MIKEIIEKILKSNQFTILMISFLLVFGLKLIEINVGINLADEGYLWYGVKQTMQGQIPIRDFQSYDPGRYFWCAAWAYLFGNEILGLRISVAIFQFIGLTLGLLILKRVMKSWWLLIIAGIIILLWMYPRHKLFDISLSIAGVYFALLLLENHTYKQHFISGLFIGLAAFFGRNHGLYNFIAFSLLILYIYFKIDKNNILKRYSLWFAGIGLGYLPMLIMLLLIPGFFAKFVNSSNIGILFLFKIKSTNIPLPIPWPWIHDYSHFNFLRALHFFSVGTFFLLLPIVNFSILIYLLLLKKEKIKTKYPIIAATFLGIIYMHHSFSRADIPHLAQGIHPCLISLLIIPYIFKFHKNKIFYNIFLGLLSFMTIISIGEVRPIYFKLRDKLRISKESLIKYDINGNNIWIDKHTANIITTIKVINEKK